MQLQGHYHYTPKDQQTENMTQRQNRESKNFGFNTTQSPTQLFDVFFQFALEFFSTSCLFLSARPESIVHKSPSKFP
jgi:hypothetical protein